MKQTMKAPVLYEVWTEKEMISRTEGKRPSDKSLYELSLKLCQTVYLLKNGKVIAELY